MSETITGKLPIEFPWDAPWLASELERVPICPVCSGTARELLQENLVDNVFFVAPGRWTLYRCTQCASAYLDPRPDKASIGKAYGTYYTHTAGGAKATAPRGMHRLKIVLSNGYLNRRYGTRRQPASRFGIWMARLFPRQRQSRDAEFRYLPKPRSGQRLLDVGCGNGDFLARASEAGWDVVGIDPDPQAVAVARQHKLDVRVGLIELFEGMSDCFDAITLSHVLEHLHEPQLVMQAVNRLLKPGGVIYIDTPNIESKGARRWGRNWRGLETPRHLVLFSLDGLARLLRAGGFENFEVRRRTAVRKSIYLSSLRMENGTSPYGREPAKLPMMMRIGLKFSARRAEDDEFLTVVAWKN